MSQIFEKPRLKSIILYYLNHYCDMEQMVQSGDASTTTISCTARWSSYASHDHVRG